MPLIRTSIALLALAIGTGSSTSVARDAAAAGAAAPTPGVPAAPRLSLTLRPGPPDAAQEVHYVDVSLAWQPTVAGPAELRMPHVASNVETIALTMEGLRASDAQGPIDLVAHDAGSGALAVRTWRTTRAVAGTMALTYRAPITNRLATRGAAPPFELRAESGAFSGAGVSFLMLPATDQPHVIELHWDLAALPRDARAVSSLGPGDSGTGQAVPVDRIADSFFMAGAIGLQPDPSPRQGFFAAWQGTPPWDAPQLLAWTGRLYTQYVRFFSGDAATRYAVFLRRNRVNPGGGVELSGSFVGTYDTRTDLTDLKITLAHEMFHTFAPAISNPVGLESSWFGEGLAVFYQRVLPLRYGEITVADFLADLNWHAGRYYTNPLADAPNSDVPTRFWQETRIRTLPYDRGSFYFATVDDAVRKASQGRRSLDELMLAMRARQQAGHVLANADWEELLRQELGATAVDAFRAMLAGHVPLPASDAFGPCFRRVQRPMRRYQLGFEPKVLTEPRRIVRGLVADSAAERAGLRDGDEILVPIGQDHLQGDQARLLELQLRREGREFSLSYLPRGETVDAYQWERVAGIADAACAR